MVLYVYIDMCIYIYIYTHTNIYIYTYYIYTYIRYRERERAREIVYVCCSLFDCACLAVVLLICMLYVSVIVALRSPTKKYSPALLGR